MFASSLRSAGRYALRALPRGTVLPIVSGPNRGFCWILESSNYGCWLGTYETVCIPKIVSMCAKGMTAFDVGAHVGYFTLMLSRLVGPNGHVFAFEPHPHNLAYLRRHLALNDIQNVTVVAKAVSGKSGTATFRGDHATGSLGDGAMVVETCRLDDFPLPDFVKIDIEGGEHAALDASRLVQRKETAWLLEMHLSDEPPWFRGRHVGRLDHARFAVCSAPSLWTYVTGDNAP